MGVVQGGCNVEMTLQRSIDQLPAIVAATDRFFTERKLDPTIRMPVDLAVEELFVNMVNYNVGSRHDIRLAMRVDGDALEVSLTDYDVEPFDPSDAPAFDPDAPLERRKPDGMGLYLVSKMVDSIHYEYHGRESRVAFRKRLAHGHV